MSSSTQQEISQRQHSQEQRTADTDSLEANGSKQSEVQKIIVIQISVQLTAELGDHINSPNKRDACASLYYSFFKRSFGKDIFKFSRKKWGP